MPYDQVPEADPPGLGKVNAEFALPLLLDQACRYHPNSQALHQWEQGNWRSLSNQAFQLASEEFALGLLRLGLVGEDRISLFMHSDVNFCIADMACLLAGLVDVPIDLGFNSNAIQLILRQTASKVVICSDRELLRQLIPGLKDLPDLTTLILAEVAGDELDTLPPLPATLRVLSLETVRALGRLHGSSSRQDLYASIRPDQIATIVYTLAPQGQPRGVVLTQASLAGGILTAFATFPGLKRGASEVALLFLPMSHIFARSFFYGHLAYGHQIYFTTPSRVAKHLRSVQPTVFITVPRLLEKVYEKILDSGNQVSGRKRRIFRWAWQLALRYNVARSPQGIYASQLQLADRLVFSQWRSVFGGRIRYLICGGAALRAELVNLFAAAQVPIFQGYGLTESSSVLCCNRPSINRAGTVGLPLPDVEIQIAADGEVLAKTPYGMQGYYQDPKATQAALDPQGWLHTGDLGEITPEGLLKITGSKKNLFKLATGKYIAPQPIEQALKRSPLVKQAIVVGAQHKFCALLIFPNLDSLCPKADGICSELAMDTLLCHPKITAQYQSLIDPINLDLPHWSTIKRFRLLHLTVTLETDQLPPVMNLTRDQINQLFAAEIEEMYREQNSGYEPRPKPEPRLHPELHQPGNTLATELTRTKWLPAAWLRLRILRLLQARLTHSQTGGSPDHV